MSGEGKNHKKKHNSIWVINFYLWFKTRTYFYLYIPDVLLINFLVKKNDFNSASVNCRSPALKKWGGKSLNSSKRIYFFFCANDTKDFKNVLAQIIAFLAQTDIAQKSHMSHREKKSLEKISQHKSHMSGREKSHSKKYHSIKVICRIRKVVTRKNITAKYSYVV